MARRLYANKRGISPVIATVILVAVTIVVAVAVAYWMGGLTGIYTRYEKVEITSCSVQYGDNMTGDFDLELPGWNASGWKILINLKNTGSADTTIDNVLINGKLWTDYNQKDNRTAIKYDNTEITGTSGAISVHVRAGDTASLTIYVKAGDAPFTSGTNIEIKLHSSGGHEYPRQITLP